MDISENIVIYGVGKRGGSLIDLLDLCGMSVGHIIDSNEALWGKKIGKHAIEAPEVLRNETELEICITVGSFLAIADIRKMLNQQYERYKEISYYSLIMYLYQKIDVEGLIRKELLCERAYTTVIFGCESGLGLGGIEEWTKGICSKFLREGEYEAHILVDRGTYNISEELENSLIRADIDSGQMFSIHNMVQILNSILPYLPCILVTSQPDQTLLAGKMLRDIFGGKVKVISGIRGGYAEINDSYMDMRECTDIYVCVNSAIRKDMIERGVQTENVYTMLCPVECPSQLERSYSLSSETPLKIGFAGRLEKEEKRIDLLLMVIEILEEKKVLYQITFAGVGSYEKEIKQFTDKHACGERIKLLGRLDKEAIKNFWKEQDVCVNISDHEGRSRSTVEAMANGAVPVVTGTWGVRDDIRDGENGYIVSVRDYIAMAERLCYLEKNRERLPEMGRKAYEELRKKSSMENHYRFWQKMIGLVLGETR